jgi:hypothetical protein
MKRVWPVALCALLFSGVAGAEDDVEPNEDPFREDEEKADEDREEGEDGEESDEGEGEGEDGEGKRKPKRKPRSFGGQGDFAVSAERIAGFARSSNTIEVDGAPDQKNGFSRLNLLVNGNGSLLGYSAPRIGFDVFATDGFSIGAAVGYASTSGDNGTKLLLAQLRVGYAYMFTRAVGVWPRVGATVESIEVGDTKIGAFAAGGELSLVIVPTSSAFFTFGPTLDAGLVGKYDPDGPGNKTDIVLDEIGLWANVGVAF